MAAQSSPNRATQLGKPSGVIKLKVRRKTLSNDQIIRSTVLKPINGPIQDHFSRIQATKRKNPFRCSPRKKPNFLRETKTSDSALFDVLDKENGENVLPTQCSQSDQNERKYVHSVEVEDSNQSGGLENEEDDAEGLETFPVDWSLKYKVRFTSPSSFSWCGMLKTIEEGEGLSAFVRCQTNDLDQGDPSIKHCIENSNLRSLFCSFTKVWLHPSLPWLDLFPRKSSNGKVGVKKDFHLTDEIASFIQSAWVCSFRSLFNLLRAGLCPYFYLVANQNTMLFQAAGISDDECVHVVITPTTKGLRDALRKEGITFTMPHLEGHESQTDFEQEPEDESDDDSNDKQEWLESMGLDKEQFPQLNSKTVTPREISDLRSIDQQPSSTVMVTGADTHALFNYLLNCKSLVASTGVLAGVPPTLLAPVAFDGATLKSLKVNQGILRHQQAKGMAQLYSLDISGPLLPGCLYEMSQLLKASQKGNFTATFSVHQPSVALNVSSKNNTSESKSILKGSSLERSVSSRQLQHYCESEQLRKVSLKELNCRDGLFSWTTS